MFYPVIYVEVEGEWEEVTFWWPQLALLRGGAWWANRQRLYTFPDLRSTTIDDFDTDDDNDDGDGQQEGGEDDSDSWEMPALDTLRIDGDKPDDDEPGGDSGWRQSPTHNRDHAKRNGHDGAKGSLNEMD